MTVHFIGAGPGAPDLITVRGLNIIRRCPLCLYAGSLVPTDILAEAPKDAEIVDTSSLDLDEIIARMEAGHKLGHDVARVHSGDPSIYGAIAEQMRRLDALGIPYDVTPGVPSFVASAALLNQELTLPGVSQTIIVTRTSGAASPVPEGEDLATLGRSGATLAIHLSIRRLAQIVRELTPHYGSDCPVVVVYGASRADELVIRGTLSDIRAKVRAAKITRTAIIFVGRVFEDADFEDSQLYAASHKHLFRPD